MSTPAVRKRFGSAAEATKSSTGATILTIIGTIASAAVSLGIFGANVEGVIIAATTDAIVLVGLFANAIHTGRIEPSAFTAAVLAFVGQVIALALDFGLVTSATASHFIAIASAVVLAGAQIAHALLSRQAP